MASIVEKESIKNDEKTTISGVYINRLKRNIPLQADPTVNYIYNFKLRRILHKHTKIKNKYNTYTNNGLPPGPICIPSINSILSVLKYKKHNYIFFCAKPDFSGYHTFAENYSQHKKNARKFHLALKKLKKSKKLEN